MNQSVTAFLPAGVLLVGVMFISGIREQHVMKPMQPLATIPAVVEGVQGEDVVIKDDERKILGLTEYSYRQFKVDSVHNFSIYVAYYDRQVQGKAIHSPKNCLPGDGWDVNTNDRVPLGTTADAPRVTRVLLSKQGVRALVYYWYQGRGRIESSEYKVKWDLLHDAALYGRTEETLVRIVVALPPAKYVNQDTAVVDADALVNRIAPNLIGSVYKVLPPFGPS